MQKDLGDAQTDCGGGMIMTNNEITTALRAVAEKYKGKFVATFETNINAMATDAANHIERLCDENNFLKAEIERLQKEYERFADIGKMYSEIKSEARKEFVNMAKQRMYKNVSAPTPGQRYVMKKFTELLDNLLKEMED